VMVRPFDNTRANLALKQKFAAALKKRSVHVDDAVAPYVLNFETEVDQTIRRPAQVSATQDRGTLRYVLTATLEEERTGRRLWQGEASYAGAPADEATTMAAMAAVLAEQVGQTVRQKNFRIE
jgi:CRISPR/Cas system CMR subunit Cmr4 (Cas7 group RAMP superfamily)